MASSVRADRNTRRAGKVADGHSAVRTEHRFMAHPFVRSERLGTPCTEATLRLLPTCIAHPTAGENRGKPKRGGATLWNVETVCVAPLDIPHPDRTSGHARYHVMEVCKPEELRRIAPNVMDVEALNESAFADARDYVAVRRTMQLDAPHSSLASQGPFSDCGAFQTISAWVEQQLEPLGRRWDGTLRQLHASDSFALIRFGTQKSAVWFKATGEPNRR